VADVIEAAVRCERHELAIRLLERLAEMARCQRHRLGPRDRGALVTADDCAEDLYHEAIKRLAKTRLPFELARAHLLQGEWLRRERRRVDARWHLRHALEMFSAMGTEAFARRAERELSASGEHVRKRTVPIADELTPQEAQIARITSRSQLRRVLGESARAGPVA
jgi:hypothetical protein